MEIGVLLDLELEVSQVDGVEGKDLSGRSNFVGVRYNLFGLVKCNSFAVESQYGESSSSEDWSDRGMAKIRIKVSISTRC